MHSVPTRTIARETSTGTSATSLLVPTLMKRRKRGNNRQKQQEFCSDYNSNIVVGAAERRHRVWGTVLVLLFLGVCGIVMWRTLMPKAKGN